MSLCSWEFWKRITSIVFHPKLKPVSDVILVDYTDNRKKNVLGETVLPVTVAHRDLYGKFYVIKGLSFSFD